MHIFTCSLTGVFLINNHIQHLHDNLLKVAIVHKIDWTPYKIHVHELRAHSGITNNETTDMLVNEGTHK